jgi:hypothetical protein
MSHAIKILASALQIAEAVLDAMIVKNQVAGPRSFEPPAAKARKRAKREADAKE